jgi:hypothetical protein
MHLTLEAESHVINIYEFSSYCKQNTALHHCKHNWLMVVKEIIAVYIANHKKPINTLCWQNAETECDSTWHVQLYHLL